MVSAERLLYCSQLETEDSLISNAYRKPDPGWPQCGMIIFDNSSFRYSADTPVVLKPLSFIVQPGEKVCFNLTAPVASLEWIIPVTGWNYWQDWSRKIFTYSDALQNGRTYWKHFH